jgi:dTDP-glucose 4,6-dehydratase
MRAIEAAAHVTKYAVINIGSPEYKSIKELAEFICDELGADKTLINEIDLPTRMTLKKRPTLDRMREILGVIPEVSFEEGVKRVCDRIKKRINFYDDKLK